MKTRVITSVIGALIIIPFFVFMHSVAFPILFAIASAIAVHEVIKACDVKNQVITAISCITAAIIPFIFHFNLEIPFMPVAIIYCMTYFIIMVIMNKVTVFNDIIISLAATIMIPSSFSVAILLRDLYISQPDKFSKSSGVFFIIVAVFCAWMTDIFAYFSGRAFGKHKLCPKISPKKTVEGAIGGVIGAIALNLILFFVFDKFIFITHSIKWYEIIIFAGVLSVISMFGDLSASVIKRNHNVKDFGKILPGHGGIMDRTDSLLFVLPALYACLYFIY